MLIVYRVLAMILVILCLVPAMDANVSAMTSRSDGRAMDVIIAIIATIVATICIWFAGECRKNRDLFGVLICSWIVAMAFTATLANGLKGRGDRRISATIESDLSATIQRDLRDDRDDRKKRLLILEEKVNGATPGSIEKQVEAKRLEAPYRRSHECRDVTLQDSRKLCQELAGLEALLADARQAVELRAEIDALNRKLEALRPPEAANSDAKLLVWIIGAIGPQLDEEKMGLRLVVLWVLFTTALEIFMPGIILRTLWNLGLKQRPEQEIPIEATHLRAVEPEGKQDATQEDVLEPHKAPPKPRKSRATANRAATILAALEAYPSIHDFAQRRMDLSSTHPQIGATPLYGAYKAHCDESGVEPVSQKTFGSALTSAGVRRIPGRTISYAGVRLRDAGRTELRVVRTA